MEVASELQGVRVSSTDVSLQPEEIQRVKSEPVL